jgi:hypothetical protein
LKWATSKTRTSWDKYSNPTQPPAPLVSAPFNSGFFASLVLPVTLGWLIRSSDHATKRLQLHPAKRIGIVCWLWSAGQNVKTQIAALLKIEK